MLIPILFKDKIEAAVKKEVNKNINAVVDWGEWDITILKSFPDLTVDHREREGEQRGALRRASTWPASVRSPPRWTSRASSATRSTSSASGW
jgi:hypothetical protein